MKNDDHSLYVEHEKHGIYLCKTPTQTTVIIDDMSDNNCTLLNSGRHKYKQ